MQTVPEMPLAAPADVTPVGRLALRDGAVALAALSLFAAADAWYAQTDFALARWVGILDGLAVGALLGVLAHEWGHFAGARWAGGIAPTGKLTRAFPMFDFDMQRSSPTAFRAMGIAGNAAHWGVVVLLALLLPLDHAPREAIVSGAFAFAFGASLTEIPVIRRSFQGASPIESFRGLSGETLRRDRRIGIAAGLLLLILL